MYYGLLKSGETITGERYRQNLIKLMQQKLLGKCWMGNSTTPLYNLNIAPLLLLTTSYLFRLMQNALTGIRLTSQQGIKNVRLNHLLTEMWMIISHSPNFRKHNLTRLLLISLSYVKMPYGRNKCKNYLKSKYLSDQTKPNQPNLNTKIMKMIETKTLNRLDWNNRNIINGRSVLDQINK